MTLWGGSGETCPSRAARGQKLVPGPGAFKSLASHLSPAQHPAEGTLVSGIEQKSGPNQLKGSLKISPGGVHAAFPPLFKTDPQVPSSETFKHLHIPEWHFGTSQS